MYALMVRMGPLTDAYADVNAYLAAHVSEVAPKEDTRSDVEKRAALKRAMAAGRRR